MNTVARDQEVKFTDFKYACALGHFVELSVLVYAGWPEGRRYGRTFYIPLREYSPPRTRTFADAIYETSLGRRSIYPVSNTEAGDVLAFVHWSPFSKANSLTYFDDVFCTKFILYPPLSSFFTN